MINEKKLFPYNHDDVKILARENVYEGYFTLQKIKLRFKTFAGDWSPITQREYLKRYYAVSVLLYDNEKDRVVLVQQFRLGVFDDITQNPWVIECVAGMLDSKEQPEVSAKRETQEETNLTIKKLIPIHTFWTSPGVTNEKVYLYCGLIDAKNAQGIYGLGSESEDIKVINLSYLEAIQLMQQGIINNAYTIIALQWLQLHHAQLYSNHK